MTLKVVYLMALTSFVIDMRIVVLLIRWQKASAMRCVSTQIRDLLYRTWSSSLRCHLMLLLKGQGTEKKGSKDRSFRQRSANHLTIS